MNPSTALAAAILAELVHQGVRDVVLAPGSRSAPLAFEALRLAELGRIRLHVRIDERDAGFLALGLAKVSGDPVAVMCTSGTAVANLVPAVVEASYSAVPLVVVTADRPVEARGIGSPQTIDQVGFFGGTVRFAADLGAPRRPDPDEAQAPLLAARASVGMAVAAALRQAGPVHCNVGFRLPLVPEAAPLVAQPAPDGGGLGSPPDAHAEGAEGPTTGSPPDAHAERPRPGPPADERVERPRTGPPADARVERPRTGSPPRPRRTPLAGCDVRELGEVLGEVPARGVLLVGDLPCPPLRGHHQWLRELATACGWPIVAEPSANLHDAPTALAHPVLVLGAEGFLEGHVPDLVLSAGLFGLSRPTIELLRRARRHVAVQLPGVGREVCDPARTARAFLTGIPLPPAEPAPEPAWLAAWLGADEAAAQVVAEVVVGPEALTGSAAVAQVWSALPDDALLLVAASWPVRQLEAFAGRRPGVRVIGNRGANGIDGLVATAWGAALAHRAAGGGPAVALLGDLAFLHDHNGLLAGPLEARPDLTLVVLDNDGGGIFHQLEQGRPEHAAQFERLFGTGQGRDLVAVAEAAGVPAVRVRTRAALGASLEASLRGGGLRVIVVDVPDRAGEARLLATVRQAVDDRLASR